MSDRATVDGVVTLMQEDRFRVETRDGRGALFTLSREANVGVPDLERIVGTGEAVRVSYVGEPDVGATAVRVERTEKAGANR